MMTQPSTVRQDERRFIVGISGASGALYGERLIHHLLELGHRVDLLVTPAGRLVLAHELAWSLNGVQAGDSAWLRSHLEARGIDPTGLRVRGITDLAADIASGSARWSAAIICPASMAICASIACGLSSDLLERVADVALKEGRKLVLVPRETPLSAIHLRNLTSLAQAGATILPAMPAFYRRPESVGDLVDFLVGRICLSLGVESPLTVKWEGIQEGYDHEEGSL